MFELDKDSALGLDGFSKIFYQHCWNSVEDAKNQVSHKQPLPNTDRSSMGNLGQIGGGGIASLNSGKVLFGFVKSFGVGSSLQGEAKGLLHGLKLCIDHYILRATINMDLQVLLDIILQKSSAPKILDGLV
ncbi:hypothetical protein ACH5RR_015670 [Cinchona calisaya]|uniref:RNase H type-1 domain-containing protein n=1 Tax=Cinchona calisaya TaxID=153742 RepID=A0ABD2ZVQ6_9GENT